MRTTPIAVMVLAAGMLLSACASEEPSILDRERVASDELPVAFRVSDEAGYRADSSRLVGDDGGRSYYVAEGDPVGFCLLIVDHDDDDALLTACGSRLPVSATVDGVHAELWPRSVPDDGEGEIIGGVLRVTRVDPSSS